MSPGDSDKTPQDHCNMAAEEPPIDMALIKDDSMQALKDARVGAMPRQQRRMDGVRVSK